jgi:hypothetical protein
MQKSILYTVIFSIIALVFADCGGCNCYHRKRDATSHRNCTEQT